MPDELDSTTARLVTELASSILPALTKSLSASFQAAVPTGEFMNALERTNRAVNDLRTQIDRNIRISIDDTRAGRSVMMQSIGTLSDEISALRKVITSLPDNIERKLQNENENHNANHKESVNNYDEMFSGTNAKLNEITDLLNELIKGLQQFSETYANGNRKYDSLNVNVNPETQETMHNNGMLGKLLNETIPALEGLIRAQSKSQTKELHELSREINAMNEQNNIALIHELHEAIEEDARKNGANNSETGKVTDIKKLLMINMCLSGACIFLSVIMFIMLMFR